MLPRHSLPNVSAAHFARRNTLLRSELERDHGLRWRHPGSKEFLQGKHKALLVLWWGEAGHQGSKSPG